MSDEQKYQSEGMDVELGRVAFEAYGQSTGGVTYDGRDIPAWEDLGPNIRSAWTAAARAVARMVSSLPHAHAEPSASIGPAYAMDTPPHILEEQAEEHADKLAAQTAAGVAGDQAELAEKRAEAEREHAAQEETEDDDTES